MTLLTVPLAIDGDMLIREVESDWYLLASYSLSASWKRKKQFLMSETQVSIYHADYQFSMEMIRVVIN